MKDRPAIQSHRHPHRPGDAAVRLVSVVIPNFNYATYLAAAIDSALNLDWPAVEVIVVDDGSTDDSRTIIEGYQDKITRIYQANQGQTAACNAGFARSRGELVVFLDSDDVLGATLIKEADAIWRTGVSKVQCQMKVIDGQGRETGAVLPQFGIVPTAQLIKKWVNEAAAYPTPPGSANVYAREFLEKIFPLDGTEPASDSYCLAAAPYLGDVLTIPKPLVAYRVHGKNDGAMAGMDVNKFGRELRRAQWRFKYAQHISRRVGREVPDGVFLRSMTTLPFRLASLRLAPPRHPIPDDSVAKVLRDTGKAFFIPQGLPLPSRVALLAWTVLVAVSPQPICERLVLWRFASSSRPEYLRRVLKTLRILKQ